jgi:hypothetical protein
MDLFVPKSDVLVAEFSFGVELSHQLTDMVAKLGRQVLRLSKEISPRGRLRPNSMNRWYLTLS